MDSGDCHIWDFLCLLVMFYQLLHVSNDFISYDSRRCLIHVEAEWPSCDLIWLSVCVGLLDHDTSRHFPPFFSVFLLLLFFLKSHKLPPSLPSFLRSPPFKCHPSFPPPPTFVLLSLPDATIPLCLFLLSYLPALIPPSPPPLVTVPLSSSHYFSLLIKCSLSPTAFQIRSLPLFSVVPPLFST